MTELEIFRAEKDRFFGSHPQSPLLPEQQQVFEGLSYFPEDPALRMELTPEVFATRETISLPTSTGDTQEYTRYGRLRFEVEGQSVELTLYRTFHGFFLPFVDSQAGKETYGAGRYIDPEPLPNGAFLVDFNLAYNPYCAYNDQWSCPLTPFENRLPVAIKAGERLFHRHEGADHV